MLHNCALCSLLSLLNDIALNRAGVLNYLNRDNQAAAAQAGNPGAFAPAPALTSLTDASNQVAAAIAQHLVAEATARANTGTLSIAAGPNADAKDVSLSREFS